MPKKLVGKKIHDKYILYENGTIKNNDTDYFLTLSQDNRVSLRIDGKISHLKCQN